MIKCILLQTVVIALLLSASCSRTGVQTIRCFEDSDCSSIQKCDNNVCTEMDGVSSGEPECLDSQVINENNECVQCVFNEDCDDSNPCNGAESCQNEACVPSTDPCLLTPEQDICQPADNEAGYVCARVECVSDGECGDDTPFCDNGTCVACLEDGHCDDGAPCNGEETCNANKECEAGTVIECGDGDACNGVETCNDETGACVDGSDPCLATEAIDICVTTTEAPGYECQEVSCLTDSDCGGETPFCSTGNICVGCVTDAHCDDGAACNGAESCNASTGTCELGAPVICDDQNACNGVETCDDATGACASGADPCLETSAIDICVPTNTAEGYLCEEVGCLIDAHCDDADLCNGTEKCDTVTNECNAGDDTVDCNDGDLCNGEETCTPSTGACVDGTPLCANGETCEEDASSDDGYLCFEVGLLQLQAGGDKTCGLSNTNDLFCWGSNLNGSLVPNENGIGGYDEPSITYLTDATYIASDVQRVAVGRNDDGYGNHVCYIHSSGDSDAVYCQGSQIFGMLGDGVTPDLADDYINNYLGAGYVTALPTQDYVDIAAGSAHTCVVSETGDLYCWGFSAQGQTGGNSYYQETRSTPALVSGFPQGSKVVSVAAGLLHTCVIVSDENDVDPSDGDLYCFGSNQDKQLAQNTTTGTCEDIYTGMSIDCESTPKKVDFPADRSVSQVCGGYNYTCAIVGDDKTVYCWGDFYQTGIDAGFPAPIPEGTTNVKEIACGMRHACVLSNNGTVTCFGDYELYDSIWEEYTNVDVVAAPLTMFPDQDADLVEHLAAGKKHSCYSTSDPETNCWGYLNSSLIYDFYWALLEP